MAPRLMRALSTTRFRTDRVLVVALALPLTASIGLAGSPPQSCLDILACPLQSNQVAFKLGDPNGYEIVAEIVQCLQCDPNGPNELVFRGVMEVRDFGPYVVSGCNPDDDNYVFSVAAPTFLVVGSGAGIDTKYTPANQDLPFPRDAGQPALLTRCVSTGNLDYSIANFALVGNLGAVTPSGFDPTILTLPSNVRGIDDGGLRARKVDLAGPFSFKKSLRFSKVETKGAASQFRFWPDGLPFRLGPGTVTYAHDKVTLAPGAPTLYTSIPPPKSNLDDLQLVKCNDDAAALWACTAGASNPDRATYNGAFFAGAWDWSSASFDPAGLDVTLTHDAADKIVVYEPAFPRGVRLDITGPASVSLTDSRITGGSFAGGRTRLEYTVGIKDIDCDLQPKTYEYNLVTSPAPELKGDGIVLAGIADLNVSATLPKSIDWTFNQARYLGCGTLMVPAVVNDRGGPGFVAGPQREWLQSVAAPAAGRGIYAGVNYNRDGVCEGSGASDGDLCQTVADCGGVGTCNVARFSPKCDVLGASTPTWVADIDGSDPPVEVAIVPGAAGQADREMVFFARASGVTGVFDAGSVAASIGNPFGVPPPPSFDVGFDRLGMAFTDSEFGPDSLLRGNVNLPWPSDTTLPFDRMTLCKCGMLDNASMPEALPVRTLGYWDQQFHPYALDFTAGGPDDCLASTTCSAGGEPAGKVCISAVTPVPHFTPDIESRFGVMPDGTQDADGIRPSGPANQKIDDYIAEHPGYPFAAEVFELSTWGAAVDGHPTKAEVLAGRPYGWVNAKGELGLPFFGQPRAAFRAQRQNATGLHILDLHGYGDLKDAPLDAAHSFLTASRKMAGDQLNLEFNLDLYVPSETADPSDGADDVGRGVILGFQENLQLGSIATAAGIVVDPGRITDAVASDLGPAGAMRLWGNLNAAARSKLDRIVPADRFTPELTAAYDAALLQLGVAGRSILPPDSVADAMHDLGIIDSFDLCGDISVCDLSPDFLRDFEVGDVDLSPRTLAKGIAGYIKFSPDVPDFDVPELAQLQGEFASLAQDGQQFFEFARGELDVQRYVSELGDAGEQALTELTRNLPDLPSAESMKLPGKQDIPFPPGIPGLEWNFDYSYSALPSPSFTFNSVTGNLDLTQGGLSGLGFKELGATLQFFADGDWYFQANAEIDFNAAGAEGHLLLGNTKDMQPLYDLDPQVVDFLGEIPRFDGVYASVGVRRNWIDLGCVLRVRTGIDVGGWYIKSADSFGGSLQGWVDGRGACLASVKGEIGMRGGMIGDLFKLQGDFWVAAGVGWDCDEDSWDSPGEALGDGGCFVCASTIGCEFVYPPNDLTCERPDYRCR